MKLYVRLFGSTALCQNSRDTENIIQEACDRWLSCFRLNSGMTRLCRAEIDGGDRFEYKRGRVYNAPRETSATWHKLGGRGEGRDFSCLQRDAKMGWKGHILT